MRDVLQAALEAERNGEPAALVSVVSTEGSTPQKAGAKMVVYPDGRIVGTIGGGCVEAEMTWRARQVIDTRRPQLASYDLTPDQAGEDGLVCGGRMQVFIEPIEGTPTLCLFGARSEEHTSELQSRLHLVCRLLLEKKKQKKKHQTPHNGNAVRYTSSYSCRN